MPKPYDSYASNTSGDTADADRRWLGAVMHVAFFLLLGGALARFLLRHPGEPRT
ncbi:sensor histidine kinase, partial [Streptomyces violaceoruber]